MDRISIILKKFISERVPKQATNIFWQMFNGIEAMFQNLEYRLDITKRERNMLTAQSLASLRTLSANNGFEPTLKIPASGLLEIDIDSKLFNRCGYPLFIPPYSVFTDKLTKISYYYNSDKSFRLVNNRATIPVVEGEIKTLSLTATGNEIDRFYISDVNIANKSIVVEVAGIYFEEVKSFFDNDGLNNNKQFIIKYSNDIQNPIIVYIKGLSLNDTISITYKLTTGEYGNIINDKHEFITENIIDSNGSLIDAGDDEMIITNLEGFEYGSNGTDENALRAAIGYNHGINLLFDNKSYESFISKYSTILIQKIINPIESKSINNLYLSRKQSLNITSTNAEDYINQYKTIVSDKKYFLSSSEKITISKILNEYEFSLSSHNIFDAIICNYAFQITLESQDDLTNYGDIIRNLLYSEFSKFLYIKNYVLNIETIFEKIMIDNNIKFEYMIFNQIIEDKKIKEKIEINTPYIIKHDESLPILNGKFKICDSTFNSIDLFFDINMVIK